jgi:hypothetical protein
LTINNTNLATSLTSGGTFMTYGGAAIDGNLLVGKGIDVNNQYITNVAIPLYKGDAVNKQYVDDMLQSCNYYGTNYDELFEHSQIVDSGVGILLPNLSFDSNTIVAFTAFAYIQMNFNMSLYILKGFYNGTNWILNSQSVGNNQNILFYITTDSLGFGKINCYNSTQNTIYIKYRKYYEVNITDTDVETIILNNNVNIPINVPGLTFLNVDILGFKTIILVSTPTKSALLLLTGLQKNGQWIMNCNWFGDNTGINVSIVSNMNSGTVQYTNTNVYKRFCIIKEKSN